MGIHFLSVNSKMNKVLLVVFALAACCAAQPQQLVAKQESNQCFHHEQALNNLSKWAVKVATGEQELTVEDLDCAACVGGVIGTGATCYPCVCYCVNKFCYNCMSC